MFRQQRLFSIAYASRGPLIAQRWLSSSILDGLAKPVQAYISASRDPYLNLSIEHYLLQKTAPDTAVLFLYVNRPSIIIGRNQNPWLEVNLALLRAARDQPETEPPAIGDVDLVRRRSGGGTVFHDEGNVNWTVISPSADFTRDKHAEMVVRALRSCGVDRARVNERHDIVLDQGECGTATDSEDAHRTPYESTGREQVRPLKVSGSAYKLTRGRALHHGTCLLSSPNLNIIPDYLHSPAKPYITARGVESVSSPVGNILLGNDEFMSAVQFQFEKLYSGSRSLSRITVDDSWQEDESVSKGLAEIKSWDWTYLQTPQFTLSSKNASLADLQLDLVVRNGAVTEGTVAVTSKNGAPGESTNLTTSLGGEKLHELESWSKALSPSTPSLKNSQRHQLASWLERMLPRVD